MDTPAPAPGKKRRRKVLMKVSSSSSTPNRSTYLKKRVKAAINVSLNKSYSWNSLKANNAALAAKLESVKLDLKNQVDAYLGLLEKNQELSEKLSRLEACVPDPAIYIQDEIEKGIQAAANRKLQAFQREVNKQLKKIFPAIGAVSDGVVALTGMCSRPSGSSSFSSRFSSASTASSTSSKERRDAFIKECATGDFENNRTLAVADDSLHDMDQDVTLDHQPPTLATQAVNEMSMIMEQSVLASPTRRSGTAAAAADLPMVEEMDAATSTKRNAPANLGLPRRVPKVVHDDSCPVEEATSTSLAKTSRRETFVVDPVGLLADESPPEGLLSISDVYDVSQDNPHIGQLDNQTVEIEGHQEKCSEGNNTKQQNITNVNNEDSAPDISGPYLEDDEVCGEISSIVPNDRLEAPKTNEKSKDSDSLQKKENPTKSFSVKHGGRKALKDLNTKAVKEKTISKKEFPVVKSKQDLFIFNQFGLENAHEQIMKKLKSQKEAEPEIQINRLSAHGPFEPVEPTITIEQDMELTMSIDNNVKQPNLLPTDLDSLKEAFSRNKADVHDGGDVNDEKKPEAVTMRFSKPGQFVFAASRKEDDGSRKNLPIDAPKARSKSKKKIAEMIENLPQEEPKSIFDFHDMTPRLAADKPKSIFAAPAEVDKSTDKIVEINKPSQPKDKSMKSWESVEDPGQKGRPRGRSKSQSAAAPKECDIDILDSNSTDKQSSDTKSTKDRSRSKSRGRPRGSFVKTAETLNPEFEEIALSNEKDEMQLTESPKQKDRSRARSRGRSKSRSVALHNECEIDSNSASSENMSTDIKTVKECSRSKSRGRPRGSSVKGTDNVDKDRISGAKDDSAISTENSSSGQLRDRSRARSRGRSRTRNTATLLNDDEVGADVNSPPISVRRGRSRSRSTKPESDCVHNDPEEEYKVPEVVSGKPGSELRQSGGAHNRYLLLGEGTVTNEPLKGCSPSPPKQQRTRGKSRDRSKKSEDVTIEGNSPPKMVSVRSKHRSRSRSIRKSKESQTTCSDVPQTGSGDKKDHITTSTVSSKSDCQNDVESSIDVNKLDTDSENIIDNVIEGDAEPTRPAMEETELMCDRNDADIDASTCLGTEDTLLVSFQRSNQRTYSAKPAEIESKNDFDDILNSSLQTTKMKTPPKPALSVKKKAKAKVRSSKKKMNFNFDESTPDTPDDLKKQTKSSRSLNLIQDNILSKQHPNNEPGASNSDNSKHPNSPLHVTKSPKPAENSKSSSKHKSRSTKKKINYNFDESTPDTPGTPDKPKSKKTSRSLNLVKQVLTDKLPKNQTTDVCSASSNELKNVESQGKSVKMKQPGQPSSETGAIPNVTSDEEVKKTSSRKLKIRTDSAKTLTEEEEKRLSIEVPVETQAQFLLAQLKKTNKTPCLKNTEKEEESVDSHPAASNKDNPPSPVQPCNEKIKRKRVAEINYAESPQQPPEPKRGRRAAGVKSYAEPKLGSKMRRGDKGEVYVNNQILGKSPGSKAKRKAEMRKDILGPMHNLIEKD